MGVTDPNKIYDMKELASGDVIVCATGVTDGALLSGVKFGKDHIETETIIYRSVTGTVRRITRRAPRLREVQAGLSAGTADRLRRRISGYSLAPA